MTGAALGYAVRRIEGADIAQRVARRLQSEAAAALLAQFPSAARHSKSHSRAVVAIALGNVTRIGIDVEWIDPERPIAQLAAYLEWGEIDRDAFYRGWTFREAYYKAFQANPSAALTVRAMAAPPDETTLVSTDGVHLFQCRVFDRFQLGLVWTSDGAKALVPTYLGQSVV